MRKTKAEILVEETIETPAARKNTADDVPRWQQTSSFASRKAEADVRNAELRKRRLVSMGETEFTQRDRKTGEVVAIPAELFVDWDHRAKRYVEIEGHVGLIPLQDEGSKKDEIIHRSTVSSRRLSRPHSEVFPPAVPTPDPRPI